MKLIIFIVLILVAGPLSATDKSDANADPFAGAFFPPDLVLLARDQIGLTQEQVAALRAHVEKAQPKTDELRAKLKSEITALSGLAKQDRVDEAALAAQFDKVLDIERELKQLHIGLLVAIKNQLTPEQRTRLREIAKDGGAKLMEEARKRLTAKVERVKEDAQKLAASGRDPSMILQAMEEKFKPLIEAGKALEAEAVLDRALEQLKADAK
jgi:Spy/CpxP family protein refolding chaperone